MDIYVFMVFVTGVVLFRYIAVSGFFYLVLNKAGRNLFAPKKLDSKTHTSLESEELRYGILNTLNFTLLGGLCYWLYTNGYTFIYTDVSDYGWVYLVVSLPLLMGLQDGYFYWMHRLMHQPRFFKLSGHHIHHQFKNPTAFSAFSVHPVEGFIEVAFRPLIICVLPLHPLVIGAFVVVSFILNVIGHCGYELFPSGYTRNPLFKIWSNATHHYLHHKRGHCNYSLYFSWWDKWMGTEAKDYHEIFESKATAPLFGAPKESQLAPGKS